MRILVNHFNNEVGTEAGVGFAFRGRQLNICQPILAVPELSRDQLLIQRMLCPSRHQNVAASGQGDDLQSIFQTLRRGHIARHHGERLNFELRGIQCKQDRHRIIGSGVGIDNDLARAGRRHIGLRETGRDKDKKSSNKAQRSSHEIPFHRRGGQPSPAIQILSKRVLDSRFGRSGFSAGDSAGAHPS